MNTQSQHSSITFYSPNQLKSSLDELVKFKRISRTSIINNLIEHYVRSEFQMMKEDKKILSFIADLKLRSHQYKPLNHNSVKPNPNLKNDYEPPMVPTINDDYDWELERGWGR